MSLGTSPAKIMTSLFIPRMAKNCCGEIKIVGHLACRSMAMERFITTEPGDACSLASRESGHYGGNLGILHPGYDGSRPPATVPGSPDQIAPQGKNGCGKIAKTL